MKFKIWETGHVIFERKELRMVFKLSLALWLAIAYLARFWKPFKTRRFDGFGMPFGHDGRMRVVPYNMGIFEFYRYWWCLDSWHGISFRIADDWHHSKVHAWVSFECNQFWQIVRPVIEDLEWQTSKIKYFYN